VALKKPSELFKQKSSLNTVQEQLVSAEPQKIKNLTEAFQVFKTNLNHIQLLIFQVLPLLGQKSL
jgi:hypothetical protein